MTSRSWIFCQIGAREHYVLPAELHRRGKLAALCTDTWVRPGFVASRLAALAGSRGRSLMERYAPELMSAHVIAAPICTALAERPAHNMRGLRGWDSIIATNEAFGARISARLQRSGLLKDRPIVFSYSYAAKRIFEAAKDAGCSTVLGQIDPGPVEDQLVAEVARRHGLEISDPRPPASYWANWRQECDLADRIIANSRWSREALIETGIDGEKIHVIPLAYARSKVAAERSYPKAFTPWRPLRLLFLGQVNIRKGAVELLQAMERLTDASVHLSLVGNAATGLRDRFAALSSVDWVGPVARGTVADHYHATDAFILPTHSDGFAITQLEAASYGVPLIVSRNCGDVIKDGEGGLILDQVSAEAIEAAIRHALRSGVLDRMSVDVRRRLPGFSPERIVDGFEALVDCMQ